MTSRTIRRAPGPTLASARRRLGALALVGLVAGCGESSRARGSSEGPGDESTPAVTTGSDPGASSSSGSPLARPRRPARRYYVASSGERCEMYWEQGDERGEPEAIACPREVGAGERIRLAGHVCLLERHDRAADQPVRCPAALVTKEALERADGGAP